MKMLKITRSLLIALSIVFCGNTVSNILEKDMIIKKNLEEFNNNVCFFYRPYLGSVNDIDDLDIKSDKFEVTDNQVLILNGNVEIDFPEGLLEAGKARVDQDKGSVQFRRKGYLSLKDYFLFAEEGSFDREKNKLELSEGEVFLVNRNLKFNFKELNGSLDNKIQFKEASMSSCFDPKKGWILTADSISINNQSKRGYAKKVKVKIYDTTILKLPYLPFSTSKERTSGFLEPTVSFSSDGLDFTVPYYQVTSKKSDITIAARNISDRGFGIEGNIRKVHGNRKNLRNFDLIYFNNDKKYSDYYPELASRRWGFKLNDNIGEINKFWVNVDWSKTSDSLVLRDLSGEITSIGSEREQNLNQNISINGSFKNFDIRVMHQGFQALNPILTNGYKKTPSIDITYRKNFNNFLLKQTINFSNFKAENIHGYLGMNQESGYFLSSVKDPIEGSRIFSNLSISNLSHYKSLSLRSIFGIKSINYKLDDKTINTKSVIVPNAKIDISSIYIKKNNMVTHALEPRISLGYVGYKNQDMNPVFDTTKISMMNQISNLERFSGMDRIGDQKFYVLNLKYKKRVMSMDKFSISLSKKFYLADREVWLDSSYPNPALMPMINMQSMNMVKMSHMNISMDEDPIMLMTKWMPNKKTMLMSYTSYSEEANTIPMGGITFKHIFENGSVGYAKRYSKMSGDFDLKLSYSEAYANFNINNNISLIAQIKNDDDLNRKIESVFGIGYENCCLKLKITASDRSYSRYLEGFEDNTYVYLNEAWDNIISIEDKGRLNFSFELKGLNSSFEKMYKLMNNSIFYN